MKRVLDYAVKKAYDDKKEIKWLKFLLANKLLI